MKCHRLLRKLKLFSYCSKIVAGLGDALGVDWASLVAESRPRPAVTAPGAARRRWQPENILARIGVSMQYAGEQLYNQIQQQIADKKGYQNIPYQRII